MNYYEFSPKENKIAEKLIATFAVILSVGSFCVARIDSVPYHAIFHFVAIVFITVAILVANKCLLRTYIFTVTEPKENGYRDFVVTEHFGKKFTEVCRIGLDDVLDVRHVTKADKSDTKEIQKKATVIYNYIATLSAGDRLLVSLRTGDAVTLLTIPFDMGLEKALCSQNSNICPN